MKQIEKKEFNSEELEYMIIPNYKECKEFMNVYEIQFYHTLKEVVDLINKTDTSKHLALFCQVALNRLVEINNKRIKNELLEFFHDRSIDFVLYDEISDKVYKCIELNGRGHKENPYIIERDKKLKNVFNFIDFKLLFIDENRTYNIQDIYNKIEES